MPAMFILSGCGATSTNQVRGVFFDTKLYDDDGIAVFEVDYNTETELTYKVNPSTGSGYKPIYQTLKSGENEENRTRFELVNGKITITSRDFEEITVQITLNGYKDVCKIRLKQYPDSIFFLDADGNQISTLNSQICADSYDVIHVYGSFGGEVRELTDERYIFNVVSTDETIISVPNINRLTIYTLKSHPSDCAVTITLLNASAKTECEPLTINYTIVPKAAVAYILVDGYDHFATDGSTIEVSASGLKGALESDENSYFMGFEAYVVSSSNYVAECDISTITSNNDKVKYDATTNKIVFSEISSNMNFSLTFWFTIVEDSGNPFAVTLNFEIS